LHELTRLIHTLMNRNRRQCGLLTYGLRANGESHR
jgi:hypothetical protein